MPSTVHVLHTVWEATYMCASAKVGKFDFCVVVSGVDGLVLYFICWGGGGEGRIGLEKEKKLKEGGASHKSGK